MLLLIYQWMIELAYYIVEQRVMFHVRKSVSVDCLIISSNYVKCLKCPIAFIEKTVVISQFTLVSHCCLLFCVRMMSSVPCALLTMMLCLLKLMKHSVIWSPLLYWRHSTWLGKFHSKKFFQLFLKVCKQHRHAMLRWLCNQ